MISLRNTYKADNFLRGADVGSLKELDLDKPQPVLVTDRLLKEAERFWAAVTHMRIDLTQVRNVTIHVP